VRLGILHLKIGTLAVHLLAVHFAGSLVRTNEERRSKIPKQYEATENCDIRVLEEKPVHPCLDKYSSP